MIDPHTKGDDNASRVAFNMLSGAERVYILGFGFDQNNLERIRWRDCLGNPKRISVTNLDNAMTINRRIAAATHVPELQQPGVAEASRGYTSVSKSTRDCYQAIELDFGALED